MTMIDLAERKAHARALSLYVFAGASITVLALSFGTWRPSFFEGMWISLILCSTLYLTPFLTMFKTSPLMRLLEDETTREHRRASSVVGLWAGLIAAMAMIAVASTGLVSAGNTARIIYTAAVAATMLQFATLELRAAR